MGENLAAAVEAGRRGTHRTWPRPASVRSRLLGLAAVGGLALTLAACSGTDRVVLSQSTSTSTANVLALCTKVFGSARSIHTRFPQTKGTVLSARESDLLPPAIGAPPRLSCQYSVPPSPHEGYQRPSLTFELGGRPSFFPPPGGVPAVVAGPVAGVEASVVAPDATTVTWPAGTRAWLTTAIRRVEVVHPLGRWPELVLFLFLGLLPWLVVLLMIPFAYVIGQPRTARLLKLWRDRGYPRWHVSAAAHAARRGQAAPDGLQPLAWQMAAALVEAYEDPRRRLPRAWPWLVPAGTLLILGAALLTVLGPRLPPGSEWLWIPLVAGVLAAAGSIPVYLATARRGRRRAARALEANAYART